MNYHENMLDNNLSHLEVKIEDLLPDSKYPTLENKLEALVKNVNTYTKPEQFTMFYFIRSLVSTEIIYNIDLIISSGLLPILISNIDSPTTLISFNSGWTVVNITTSNKGYDKNALNPVIYTKALNLVKSPIYHLKEIGLWLIANIIFDDVSYRDTCLANKFDDLLINIINDKLTPISCTRVCTYTFTNLCRGTPNPSSVFIEKCICYIRLWCFRFQDTEVKSNIMNAIFCLICEMKYFSVLDTNIIKEVISLLSFDLDQSLQLRAASIVGEVFFDNENLFYMLQFMNLNVVGILNKVITYTSIKEVLMKFLWVLSNIAASKVEYLEELIKTGTLKNVVSILADEEYKIKKECIYVIGNFLQVANIQQIKYCLSLGAIELMLNHLKTDLNEIAEFIIESIYELLKNASLEGEFEHMYTFLMSQDIKTKLSQFESIQFENISNKATKLLKEFFEAPKLDMMELS